MKSYITNRIKYLLMAVVIMINCLFISIHQPKQVKAADVALGIGTIELIKYVCVALGAVVTGWTLSELFCSNDDYLLDKSEEVNAMINATTNDIASDLYSNSQYATSKYGEDVGSNLGMPWGDGGVINLGDVNVHLPDELWKPAPDVENENPWGLPQGLIDNPQEYADEFFKNYEDLSEVEKEQFKGGGGGSGGGQNNNGNKFFKSKFWKKMSAIFTLASLYGGWGITAANVGSAKFQSLYSLHQQYESGAFSEIEYQARYNSLLKSFGTNDDWFFPARKDPATEWDFCGAVDLTDISDDDYLHELLENQESTFPFLFDDDYCCYLTENPNLDKFIAVHKGEKLGLDEDYIQEISLQSMIGNKNLEQYDDVFVCYSIWDSTGDNYLHIYGKRKNDSWKVYNILGTSSFYLNQYYGGSLNTLKSLSSPFPFYIEFRPSKSGEKSKFFKAYSSTADLSNSDIVAAADSLIKNISPINEFADDVKSVISAKLRDGYVFDVITNTSTDQLKKNAVTDMVIDTALRVQDKLPNDRTPSPQEIYDLTLYEVQNTLDDVINDVQTPLDVPDYTDDPYDYNDIYTNNPNNPSDPNNPNSNDPINPNDPSNSDDFEVTDPTFGGLTNIDLTNIFPFCIPFDIAYIVRTLKATPEAPVFRIPFKFEKFGIDYEFVIDFNDYSSLSTIMRTFCSIIYLVSLVMVTRRLVKG